MSTKCIYCKGTGQRFVDNEFTECPNCGGEGRI